MHKPGTYTHSEILSQPEAWEATLAVLEAQADSLHKFWQAGRYEHLIFTGCGSSYYLSLAAAALARELTGRHSLGLPASEIWLSPRSAYSPAPRTLLVAASRSGETTETIKACQAFQLRADGDLLTLSGYPDKPLAGLGQLNLVFPAAQEDSVVQTRSFSSLFLATTALLLVWSGQRNLYQEMQRLPEACRRLLDEHQSRAHSLGNDPEIEQIYFLGSGPRYGLACELSLKMKETSLTHSEPFHFMEFRHGPMSMANRHTLMVGLLSEFAEPAEVAVLAEMRALGAQVLALGERNSEVSFNSGLHEAVRNVLCLPIGQLLGYERALSKGIDPDNPHNLEAVIKL